MDATEGYCKTSKGIFCWHQFSFRKLLVFMLLASIGLSWPATRMHNARRQKEAVQAILRIEGCQVAYDGEDVFVPKLYIGKRPPLPPVTWTESLFGKDFAHRAGTVGLPATRVDEVVPQLRRLPYLRRVVVLRDEGSGDRQVEAAAERIGREVPSAETIMLEFVFNIGEGS
jgi:hypothetical protein